MIWASKCLMSVKWQVENAALNRILHMLMAFYSSKNIQVSLKKFVGLKISIFWCKKAHPHLKACSFLLCTFHELFEIVLYDFHCFSITSLFICYVPSLERLLFLLIIALILRTFWSPARPSYHLHFYNLCDCSETRHELCWMGRPFSCNFIFWREQGGHFFLLQSHTWHEGLMNCLQPCS